MEAADALTADVVVVGAGAAGLAVAASAAQAGAIVVLVEVAPELGGAAALSQGVIWTAPSAQVFLEQDPHGDVATFESMLADLPEVFSWLSGLGVEVGPPLTTILGFGHGRQIDIASFVSRCRMIVERAGGTVLVGSSATELLMEDGHVCGVEIEDVADGTLGVVQAPAVVLATGGFQSSAQMMEELLFPGASALPVRSITTARGDGIRLGLEAGGSLTQPTTGFYGHLVPFPLDRFHPPDFVPLAQYHSEHGLLLDKDGQRITDESLGDHFNAEVVARLGSALLVIDARILREHVLVPFIPGMAVMDNMAEAGARGANYVSAESIAQVAEAAAEWGYDPDQVQHTVADFNDHIASGTDEKVPRHSHRTPISEPPFAALEVQAAITFTYRGLRTDMHGRVLGEGGPVPGLHASGVDAGGLNTWGYTGGLVRGFVLGRRLGAQLAARPD